MKVIKLSFLFLAITRYVYSQFNNPFNSAYSSNLLKKKPNSISSFFFQNENSRARSETPRNSRYNLTTQTQPQQSNNNFLQNVQQQRQQFGVNYSPPNSRVSFTPTSQQQITNSQFLTANDITSQKIPLSQNSIQYSQRNQNQAFGNIPTKGQIQIGQPQNFSQQIQNQKLQNKITPQDLSLTNQLSFDFNSAQAQQMLMNQQLQQQQQIQQQIPQQQQIQQSIPQQQIPQQQVASQIQQPQQTNQADLLALLQQLQNQQQPQVVQQQQGLVQQVQNPGQNNLDPQQQQLQLLLNQLQQNEQTQQQSQQIPKQIQQEEITEQQIPNKKRRTPQDEQQIQNKKRRSPQEEDILSDFFNKQSEGSLDDFFKDEEPVQITKKKRPPTKKQVPENIDPPTDKPKKSAQSSGDINLFELFNNQGDSGQFGNSEAQGEVVHYIDDPSQLNTSEPEVTSIDQFIQAGEIPGGGMPF